MSAEEQKAVRRPAREATQFERKTIREFSAKALGDLKKNGMQVTELSAAEQAAMRDKLKPVVDKYSEGVRRGRGEGNARGDRKGTGEIEMTAGRSATGGFTPTPAAE